MKNRGSLTELKLRKRIRDAVRALGRPLTVEEADFKDSILGPLQSESIQSLVTDLPMHEEEVRLGFALEYRKLSQSREMKRRQLKSAARRHQNLAARDSWVREHFAQRKNRNRNYSLGAFHRDLDSGAIPIPRKFARSLKRNGKLVTLTSLTNIIDAG